MSGQNALRCSRNEENIRRTQNQLEQLLLGKCGSNVGKYGLKVIVTEYNTLNKRGNHEFTNTNKWAKN